MVDFSVVAAEVAWEAVVDSFERSKVLWAVRQLDQLSDSGLREKLASANERFSKKSDDQ